MIPKQLELTSLPIVSLTNKGTYKSASSTIIVTNDAGLTLKNPTETIIAGDNWSAETNFGSATNVDGSSVAFKDITVTYQKDGKDVSGITTAGSYEVTYSFSDSLGKTQEITSTVTVNENKVSIVAKPDASIVAGSTWNPADNFVSATDTDGSVLTVSDMQVTYTKDGQTSTTLDTTIAGVYTITYWFTDSQGNRQSATSTLTITNDAAISVKNPTETIIAGDNWSAETNFGSATNVDGSTVDFKDITVAYQKDGQTVNGITTAGIYYVTYSFNDSLGNPQSITSTVTVDENKVSIVAKPDSSIVAGSTWNPADNLVSASDTDGSVLTVSDMQITYTKDGQPVDQLDTKSAGTYVVTYSFIDQQGNHQSASSTIIVTNDAGLTLKNPTETIVAGDNWSAETNVASATNVDGSTVDFKDITVTYKKDGQAVNGITTAGTYYVTYSFTDSLGNLQSKTSTVTVTNDADLTLTSNTETIIAGDNWSAETNFASATNVDGSTVNFKDITVTYTKDGQAVDGITTAGTYKVTYSFTDSLGKTQSKTSTVTVAKNQVNITTKPDSSIVAGSTWKPADNFASATDTDGTKLTVAGMQITYTKNGQSVDQLDTKSAGTYVVTYSFIDQQGNRQSASSTIIVTNDAGLTLKNPTENIIAGDKWSAETNFAAATNVDGASVNFSNVTVTYQKDGQNVAGITTAGTYKVTYSFTDALGNIQSKTSTVTVARNQVNIVARPGSTIVAGSTWSAQDNFGFATDVDGTDITLKDLTVTYTKNGQPVAHLDPNVAGTYVITYSFTDQQGHLQQAKSTLTVTNDAGLQLTNTTETIVAGDKWSAETNFNTATNVDGTAVDFPSITVTYMKNGQSVTGITTAGTYQVTYRFTDSLGIVQTKTSTVTVAANQVKLVVKPATTIVAGDNWSAQTNFISATDVDGTNLNINDMTITYTKDGKPVASLNPKIAGTYVVTYRFTDRQGRLQQATSTVTVTNAAVLNLKAATETIVAGDNWSAKNNFKSATNVDGSTVAFANVTVTYTKNGKAVTGITTAGTYQVTYYFIDTLGNRQTKTSTVTVTASQSQLKVKPTTNLTTGKTWHPVDNLITAKNTDGTNVAFQQLTVTIKNRSTNQLVAAIDTSKAGTYLVTYYFIDQQGQRQTAQSIVTITAKDDQADLIVKPDTDISVDDTWHVEDGFGDATDSDGSNVSFDKINVTMTKDGQPVTHVKTAGTYQITYQFTAKNGQLQQATLKLTVKPKSAHGQATQPTLPQTDESTHSAAVVFGTILLALTGLLSGFRRSKNKRQD
ncbi:bacterial Ig-like domain-containing protein [Lactobacillus sp. CBA3605]|uniref:bacterial Ig-like domain-containing protein n=1 Tax=Lactobacillus sp. CBA3605 TaxID=2099788 RepID=UPI001319D50C|nr:bacterial Ig-like domain-containing protein [Lactobacillus sp. CBA3605]